MSKRDLIFYSVVSIVLLMMFYQNTRIHTRLSNLEARSYVVNNIPEVQLPDSFDYVINRFRVYNPNIDTNTVISFINTIDHYGLRQGKIFDMLIGQILLESRAMQYYDDSHPNRGKVIRGTSGEVGITQIMPTTALFYLDKVIKDDYELYDLGASDFSFVKDSLLTNEDKLNKVIKWLSKTENNFALWGYIMREGLENNDMLSAFVIYNAGKGGMIKYITSNGTLANHKYLIGIEDRIRYSSGAIDA
jgi:hypothetical protein